MPLPDRDFDTTEVAVPWRVLTDRGHEVVFATERGGSAPVCDRRLLDGVMLGRLGAAPEPRAFYAQLVDSAEFRDPIAWSAIEPGRFDGLILPGGHAPGMRQYLGSRELRKKVVELWRHERPVGAICHGVLVLARSRDRTTGRSVIADKRTTCLPKDMERSAFYLTAWKLGRYYRTYPAYVQDEVVAALDDPRQFERGPRSLRRGTADDDGPAFVVPDGRYLSARWPGDAYLFARSFAELLEGDGRVRAPRENVEVARLSFEAIRSRDIDALLELYNPDIEFLPLTGTRVESGGYIGHGGVRDYFEEVAEVWENMRPHAEDVRIVGDQVVLVGGCAVRGRGSGAESDSPMAWVLTIRDGKVSRHRGFRTGQEALAAVGLTD